MNLITPFTATAGAMIGRKVNDTLQKQRQMAAKSVMNTPTNTSDEGYKTSSNGILANGISSGTKNANSNMTRPMQQRQSVPYSNGMAGVRQSLVNAGLDNSKIGYDNGNVTYNGVSFKPDSVSNDGVSYASRQNINSFVDNAVRASGGNMVSVNDYANQFGFSPEWRDGKVYIAGQEVPYSYIDDSGRSHTDQSVLNRIIAASGKRLGMSQQSDILDNYNQKYKKNLDSRMNNIDNMKFDYNMETDPAYQAYKAQYEREGKRAYFDSAAQMAAQNGGNMTSMAQSQANQAYGYYLDKLNDRVPELQANAYNRFENDRQARERAYDRYANSANDDYNKMQYADQQARAQYKDWQNSQAIRQEAARKEITDKQSDLAFETNHYGNILANMGTALDTAYKKGSYDPFTAGIAQTDVNASPYAGELRQFNEITKPKEMFTTDESIRAMQAQGAETRKNAAYNNSLDMQTASYKAALQYQYNIKEADHDAAIKSGQVERAAEIEREMAWIKNEYDKQNSTSSGATSDGGGGFSLGD